LKRTWVVQIRDARLSLITSSIHRYSLDWISEPMLTAWLNSSPMASGKQLKHQELGNLPRRIYMDEASDYRYRVCHLDVCRWCKGHKRICDYPKNPARIISSWIEGCETAQHWGAWAEAESVHSHAIYRWVQFTLYKEVIKSTCEKYGYDAIRADDIFTNGQIINDITRSIEESSVIIADITPNNPNVFYEVGYAHATRKPTILLCERGREKLPFDVSGFRTLFYDNTIGGKSQIEERLSKHLENIIG